MKAHIYRPAKNAMQSGRALDKWVLEFEPEAGSRFTDDMMGWIGSSDMRQEIKLKFATKEAAVAYARRNSLDYTLHSPQKPKTIIKSYADNFK